MLEYRQRLIRTELLLFTSTCYGVKWIRFERIRTLQKLASTEQENTRASAGSHVLLNRSSNERVSFEETSLSEARIVTSVYSPFKTADKVTNKMELS